ncbi:TonB-dependent receptor domain-containing protein [Sessilibacter corallicola]|uniref:TonB-dependent receptor n=1 Tax=Sessilibacter corallicola TaxID=2904075 RepID=A0ABQ0AF64_9GAMM
MFQKNRLSLAVAGALAMSCTLAGAQEIARTNSDNVELEEVTVVGTQIKGVDVAGDLPVTVLDSEYISVTGALDGDELLRSIPQIGSVGFGASRGGITGVNAARGDVGSVNLRSLGEGNTLVLLNGRRMVLHPITQTSSIDGVPVTSVNSNTLPVLGLERVEVLRDGAGALYGSDAVAGVVNYVAKTDYEGGELNIRVGTEEASSRDDLTVSGVKGFVFNGGQTNLTVSASYDKKNGITAAEKSYSRNQDLRPLAPEAFRSDTSLDNRSSLEAFARVDFDGLGLFHVRPLDLVTDSGGVLGVGDCGGRGLDGADTVYNDGVQDLCLDSSGQDRALRPNRNETRTLTPDVERINLFGFLSHEFDNGVEFYNDSSYYYSKTERFWEQSAILSNGRFHVPADYYYNPFGPVTFDDGRVNPNRLPGLDTSIVPEEGLGFELNSFRPVDTGPRRIEVESTSYRFLNGLRGDWGVWSWDTAVLYSEAEVEDTAKNRISTPLLQAQLSLDTPDAYNIFTGVNPADPSSIRDLTVNPRSSIDPFIVDATRDVKTTLTLVDFKISNPAIFSLPAGDAALGTGIEWRKEELDENNSAIFDGSQPFIDPLDTDLAPGEVTNVSSLQGSSVRPDVSADRTVFSLYGELILPLVTDLPGIQSLDAQVAVRYEDFDDVGNITRPKLALSWQVNNWLKFRGAYSEGFRAPNLIQLNSPATSITTSVDDYAEGIALGTGDINEGPSNGNYILETSGNADLKPEESENLSFGIVVTPTDNLVLTADWWEIETTDTVGVLSDENESRLDAVLRAQGSSNPNVIRAAPAEGDPLGEILRITRRFENLNKRTVEGVDLGVNYSFYNDTGSYDLKLNGARILTFDQEPGNAAAQLVAAGADPSVLGSAVGSQIEGEFVPKWRASASLNWNSADDRWGASTFVNYVGSVTEPTVTNAAGDALKVDSHTTVNLFGIYRGVFGEGSSIRLGINNVFDEDPPFANEAFGFEGELHSNRSRYFYLDTKYTF